MFAVIFFFIIAIILLLPRLLKWYKRKYYGDAWKVPGPPGKFLLGNILDIGLTPEASIWKKNRRLLGSTLHIKLIEQFFEVYNATTDIFVNTLKKESNFGSIDVFPLLKLYAIDVICETIMGIRINAQSKDNMEYFEAVEDFLNLFIVKCFSIVRRCTPIYKLTKDYRREQEVLKIIRDMTRDMIRSREKERNQSNVIRTQLNSDNEYGIKKKIALLDLLLDLKKDKVFTEANINDHVNTFLAGGYHTVSVCLAFVLYELAKYPEMQSKMLEEINFVVGKNINEPITPQHIKQFKFMERFIKEVLRLYPPGTFIERRLSEDFTIDNYKLRKDTNVMVYIYGLHRNEEYFPDPEKFDPDRFLPENINQRHPYAYIPFSRGPRNCLGQQFAMCQMKVFLGVLLRKLELKPVADHKPKLANHAVLKSLNGLPIYVNIRKES